MKKIVSLVLVMLMVFSFASISFAAADAVNCEVTIKKGAISADNKMNVDFVIDFPEEISTFDISMTLQYDKSALTIDSYALDGGIDWSIANSNVNYEADKSLLWFEDTTYTGSTAASRLTVSVVFSVLDSDTTKHDLKITSLLGTDAERWDTLISDFTVKTDTPTPTVKTITKTGTDVLINNAKEKSEGVTTDVEIGGAAGFAFTIPAGVKLDDNMIWSLTTADGKLYSEKINAGLSTLGEGSPVKVAATFVTGTHKGADAANKEITAVNGIFKAGEDFYFTDAADAKNQAAAE